MPRRLITTGSAFEQAFGYSRAVVQEPFVFVAGTTGYAYATMLLPEDAAEQARNCWRTIETVLRDAGASLAEIGRRDLLRDGPRRCRAGPAGLRRDPRRN